MSKFKENNTLSQVGSNYLVNEQIKALQIQVIDKDGNNLGTLSRAEALKIAENAFLDLVQVGQKDSVAIAKIMDFGKFLYAKKKQMSEAKKKQKIVQIKEIKIRPNIDEQDYQTKLRQAVAFLQSGKKVKFTLQFKGREFIMSNDIGKNFFTRLYNDLESKKLGSLVEEKEQKNGAFWFKIYYLK